LFKKNALIGVCAILFFILSGCSNERPSTFKNTNKDKTNEVSKNNSTNTQALMDAITNSETEKVKKLLSKKTNPNTKDDLGNTPLIVSVQYGDVEITKLLLEAGADPNIQDDLGITPLAMAIENDNKEIADLLNEHGAK
jgi:ankyrin repeat protein